jgi:hypothetical protein
MTLIAGLLLAAPAAADTPLPVLQRAGVLGIWAPDCTQPAGGKNPYVIIEGTADGKVRRRFEGLGTLALDGTVEGAEALTPTTVRLLLRNNPVGAKPRPLYEVVLEVTADSTRSLRATSEAGRPLVRDGVDTVDGKPTPTLRRCRRT